VCSVCVLLLSQCASAGEKREAAGARNGASSSSAVSAQTVSTTGGRASLTKALRRAWTGVACVRKTDVSGAARLAAGVLLIELVSAAASVDAIERTLARRGLGGDVDWDRSPKCRDMRGAPREKEAAVVVEAEGLRTDDGGSARDCELKLNNSGCWSSCSSSAQLTTTRAPRTVARANRGRREWVALEAGIGTAFSPGSLRA
jgi:hypothetical protein